MTALAAPLRRLPGLLTALVLVGLLAATAIVLTRDGTKELTASFEQTPALYVGDDVRIMGLVVGRVEEITPLPDEVRVRLSYEADRRLPATVQAVLMTPSLVGQRYVQLTPPTAGTGPELADRATIPRGRTAVPVEWDELKSTLTGLTRDLGPGGSAQDARGALNRLIDVGHANLAGQGRTVRETIHELSRAVTTVADGRHDLVATVRNLQLLVATLRGSDGDVARFTDQLAQVSDVLATSRDDLRQTLATLDRVAPAVTRVVAENRTAITDRTAELERTSATLARNRQELANLLQRAPTVGANALHTYDPSSGAFTGAIPMLDTADPARLLCSTVFGVAGTRDTTSEGGRAALETCRGLAGPLTAVAGMNVLPVTVDPRPQQPVRAGAPR